MTESWTPVSPGAGVWTPIVPDAGTGGPADHITYKLDMDGAPTRSVYLRLRDSVSSVDVGMRDDAVTTGQAGFDNTDILSDALEYCANRKIPFILKPAGYGGRFYLRGTTPIPNGTDWRDGGGTLLAWGRGSGDSDVHVFTAFNGERFKFDFLRLDGDLYGGSTAPETGSKIIFGTDAVFEVGGGLVRDWNGGWGIANQGDTDVEGCTVRRIRAYRSATDTMIWLGNLALRHTVDDVVVTGDPERLVADGNYVDDAVLVAYANFTSPLVSNLERAVSITNVYAQDRHASAVKVGGAKYVNVRGVTARNTGWIVDAFAISTGSYQTNGAEQCVISDCRGDGSRVQTEEGGSTAGYRFQAVKQTMVVNCTSRATTAALADPDAQRPRWGFVSDEDCEGLTFDLCHSYDASEAGFSPLGKDIRIGRHTVEEAGKGAGIVLGTGATGYLEVEQGRYRGLFRDPGESAKRVWELNGASGLGEVRFRDNRNNQGESAYGASNVFLFNDAGPTPVLFEQNYDDDVPISLTDFCVYLSANTTSDKTGDTTAFAVPFDTVLYDAGQNVSGGVYTAPIAGHYRFRLQIYAIGVDSSHAGGIARLDISDERTLRGQTDLSYVRAVTSGIVSYFIEQVVNLSQGDTVTPILRIDGGTKTVGVIGTANMQTSFSGELVR